MKRPSLRSILLVVNLTVLLLPVAGIWALRVYESTLVRQTESSLIAQSAFIAAAFRNSLLAAYQDDAPGLQHFLADTGSHIGDVSGGDTGEPAWAFRAATLDLAVDPVLSRPVDAVSSAQAPDPIAADVGRELERTMNEAQRTTLAAMRIVDPNGIVIGSTGDDTGLSLGHLTEIERALSGEVVSTLRLRVSDEPTPALGSMSRGANIRVFVGTPIVHDGHVIGAVMLSRTPVNIAKAVYEQRTMLIAAALVLIAIAGSMSLFTAFTIRRPIEALVRQTRRAILGEPGAVTPLEAPVTEEIAMLSGAVAQMADNLEERANYIRDSMHHISHEFKTPLTAIVGSIELLRDHADTMSDAQRQRFLDNLESDAHRLDNLLRRYLELARADAVREASGRSHLSESIEAFAEEYRKHGLDITVSGDPESDLVAANQETCDGILGNLFENARQHAGASCKIAIELTKVATPEGSFLRIRFADDGPGIARDQRDTIFEPFVTSRRDAGGTGLGLALARALARASNGTIDLESAASGSVFLVDLPVADS